MNSIADLVARHRDYCAQFYPHQGMMCRVDRPGELSIEHYNFLVSRHLSMTVTKIKHLNQWGK